MELYSLKSFHPSQLELKAGIQVAENILRLRYQLQGDLSLIKLPMYEQGLQKDNLWQTTCFECFALNPDGKSYVEFNFSPKGFWNIYVFKSYRELAIEKWILDNLQIKTKKKKNLFVLDVQVKSKNISFIAFGLTAVIDGPSKSYWALDHKGDRPDFHNRETFCLFDR